MVRRWRDPGASGGDRRSQRLAARAIRRGSWVSFASPALVRLCSPARTCAGWHLPL